MAKARNFFDDMYSVAEGQQNLDDFLEQEDENFEQQRQQRIQAQQAAADAITDTVQGGDFSILSPLERSSYREANEAELQKRREEVARIRQEREERRAARQAELEAREQQREDERTRRREELEARRREFNEQRAGRTQATQDADLSPVRQRMQADREGFERRRDERELERLRSNLERGLYVSERDRQKIADATPDRGFVEVQGGSGYEAIRINEIQRDGQTTRVLNDRNVTKASEWTKIFNNPQDSGAKEAIEVLDNTVDAIGSLKRMPEAVAFAERYNVVKQQLQAVEVNDNLTAGEKRKAKQELVRRRATLATEALQYRNLGSLVARQAEFDRVAEQRQQQDLIQDRVAQAGKITDMVNRAAEKQFEETGIRFSASQRRALFQQLYNDMQQDQQIVQSLGETGRLPEGPVQEQPAQRRVEDADGGLILYADADGRPLFRSQGGGMSSMPAREVDGVIYPAPANEIQVKSLPKGAIYLDPKNPGVLALQQSGSPSPKELFESARLESQANLTKDTERISKSVMVQMEKEAASYRESMAQAASILGVSENQVLQELQDRPVTSGISDSMRAQLQIRPPGLDSQEGRDLFQKRVQRQLEIEDAARKAAIKFQSAEDRTIAPFTNASRMYSRVVNPDDPGRLLLQSNNGELFEGYVVRNSDSMFKGTALPIFDDYQDLERSGDDIFNVAYFNPVEGKVMPIDIPAGDGLGTITEDSYDIIVSQLLNAYPGLVRNELQAKKLMIRAAKHMGYTVPESVLIEGRVEQTIKQGSVPGQA